MRLSTKLGIGLCLILGTACASVTKRNSTPPGVAKTSETTPKDLDNFREIESGGTGVVPVAKPDADSEAESKDAVDDVNNDFDNEEGETQATVPTKDSGRVPFEFNQKVAEWIQYFSQKDRERFQRYLDRGEPYREVIENILDENNVPSDLYYLGLIESGFDSHAKSHAQAVGVWQFVRSTGKLYGLGVDAYVDERRDPIRATEAAAKFLRDLYREFHSWYLAMAAYNAGIGRIRGAIRRGGTHDFWELVAKRKLPRETMEYVPKFLAARYIGEHPDLFAFYLNEEKKYPSVELVKVPSPVEFSRIEKTSGIPEGTLAFVNPHYLKYFTHPAKKVDEIWVPEQYQKKVEDNFDELTLARLHIKPQKEKIVAHTTKVKVYVVRSGDSLKTIARKRGLSVAYLKQVNGLRSSKILPGQRLKLSATSYRQRKVHPRKRRRNHR